VEKEAWRSMMEMDRKFKAQAIILSINEIPKSVLMRFEKPVCIATKIILDKLLFSQE
jgi:hypothetical protein